MQKKASLYLLLLLIVPVILYGIFQISSLSEDEENINLIYQNQLDAILFSVNQYSDDVVNEWVMSLEEAITADNPDQELNSLLEVNPGIRMMFITDSVTGKADRIFPDSLSEDPLVSVVNGVLWERGRDIQNLRTYATAGYQKIESAQLESGEDLRTLMLYFVLKDKPGNSKRVGGILIDPESFIQVNLGPRLQTIAEERFVITAFRKEQEQAVFSTSDSVQADGNEESMAITKDFWLLPDYYLGIDAAGESVFDIIRARTLLNIGLLVVMLLILAAGLYLIFRNVRKELRLAQNKSEFVSNVSHELRTPLALISMFAETLEMGRVKNEEKKQEYYQIIHKETNRLTGIVNKILTFSQMDANRKEFHLHDADLNEIVCEIMDTYSFHFSQKGFESDLKKKEHILPVKADREAMQEVLINLLDNAIKYSGDAKKIEVLTGTKDKYAFVRVRDFGLGIRKEDQKQIFEKFYRVSTGDIAKSKGTGLGLSLVKHIIDNHGGRVEVDSSLGKGSDFTIYLPLIQTENV